MKVDIIVPLQGQFEAIDALLEALVCQASYIENIIIVISREGAAVPSGLAYTRQSLDHFFSRSAYTRKGFKLIVLSSSSRLFPGAARNVGIMYSESKYLAFLDVNTLPPRQWLHNFASSCVLQQTLVPMLGTTAYVHDTYIKKIIIASSYGFLPIETLPGSIIAREHILSIGLFNPLWRAGEDIDLVVRLKSLYPQYRVSPVPSKYVLTSNSPFYYFTKWIRNYSLSAPYQSLASQSHALMLLMLMLVILIAFNWNALIANWDVRSSLYLANITKVSIFAALLTYLVLRGWYLPFRKGAFRHASCSLSDLVPILVISAMLDLSKSVALLLRSLPVYRSVRRILRGAP